jgi:phosphate transport system substrate-binding protein
MFRLLIYIIVFIIFLIPDFALSTDAILNGAGATFPHPLYKKWFEVYRKKTGIRISYQAVGSGSGIKQLLKKSVDFGATDAFLSDQELERLDNSILHVPTCLGAVAIIYSLPNNPALTFTPELIADIFLGKINRWTDRRIAKANPKIDFPDLDISVVHRSDGSGTTFVFTDYLSKINSLWQQEVGRGKTVRWPVGIGVERNPGVANYVKKIPGSIGYVEIAYAKSRSLPVALIRNKSGNNVRPTLESISIAANVRLPSDTRILITNTSADMGYPISAFTWLIFYKDQTYDKRPKKKATMLAKFLWWAIHEGQQFNNQLLYAFLPDEAVKKGERVIRSMTHKGNPVVDW